MENFALKESSTKYKYQLRTIEKALCGSSQGTGKREGVMQGCRFLDN